MANFELVKIVYSSTSVKFKIVVDQTSEVVVKHAKVVSIGVFLYYFFSFSYNGVCFDGLQLSVSDFIVKKVPMETES